MTAMPAPRVALGRLVALPCEHGGGWSGPYGVDRCRLCGMERHTDYGSLRMPLPDVPPEAVWGIPRLGAPGERAVPDS
ncbi:DUF6255 family natural product biosynthesis protein [Streptomyces gamaensis]|uniref:DUF6255 family natural product biosynthesis protein n=1 Tax=Streptomyces gamaensis TaxID=1763542 RepID=A0ABW0Z2L1_9ACTN